MGTGMDVLLTEAGRQGWTYERGRLLSTLTSFKIGGPAELLLTARTEPELTAMLAACHWAEVPFFIVGNGSNLLVPDEGLRGAVILLDAGLWGLALCDDGLTVECGAGVRLSGLANFALKHGLTGLEFAHGIPGTAGGAAYMNAGAYGGEMANVLTTVRHLDAEGQPVTLPADRLNLGYRTSVYKTNGGVITRITVRLRPGNPAEIGAKMRDLMARRRDKQPLDYPSAGSVFKRPPGYFAGTLIETCGLKGRAVGGAMVSEKHAGFIVNAGGATCADVKALIALIRAEVLKQTGVELECEIKLL